ncbi:hypothetical protein GALMADRAFT_158595 [Galerina marginata CBS 339.88]|uniref:Uncharacterized protein n=1 Tax=Galerina marginata (strain CBS 339.88) TaxID=685588 RepID=A0A067SQ28_GALM3|nr:hypothetical protein GALMADRAFT_158595 [Galerina marginata CBS 339.88]
MEETMERRMQPGSKVCCPRRRPVRPNLRPTGPRKNLNPKNASAKALNQETTPTRHRVLALPDDVLSQVFEYVCQPDLDPISNPRWRRTSYPLWLGKVCRAWRECAWATSEIWTTIIVRISTHNLGVQTDILREWLERAKGRPLDVYIEQSTGRLSPTWRVDVRLLLSLLTGHSEQWRRIGLYHLFQYEFFFRTIPIPGLSLPLLRHASIGHGENEILAKFEVNLKAAPLLQTLSLSNFTFNNPDYLSSYPTDQITRLFLSSSIQIDLNDLLSRFPELRELTWSKCQCFNLQPTIHEGLEFLDVDFGIESSPGTFFYQLSLPTLKSLSLRISKPFQYTTRLEYISPCFQKGCSLTQLTLECQMTSTYENDLINLLSSEPISSSLTELRIRDLNFRIGKVHVPEQGTQWGLSQIFFDHLYTQTFPNFLPNLEVLEYEGQLTVQTLDFINPLMIRSGALPESSAGSASGIAALRRATITADQKNYSISGLLDAQYLWEIISLVEAGLLVLVNMDGTTWV